MSPANPTAKTYAALNRAFDFFNDWLFGGELPACLVTLQRKNKAYGYFAVAGLDRRTARRSPTKSR